MYDMPTPTHTKGSPGWIILAAILCAVILGMTPAPAFAVVVGILGVVVVAVVAIFAALSSAQRTIDRED